MASNMKAFLKGSRTIHTVGTVTSFRQPQTLTNGAEVTEVGGVDVFRLVELAYDANGKATVKYATASAKAGNVFLTVTPQNVLESFGEMRSDFYIDKGEMATCAIPEIGLTFQTSAIDATGLKGGEYVTWDDATKKFKKLAAAPAGTECILLQVIDVEAEESYTLDAQTLVELRVVK